MRKLLFLFLAALTPFWAGAQQQAAKALNVQDFYFDEILHTYASVYTGASCAYSLRDDSLLIFAFSFDTHVGVVKIGDRMVELTEDTLATQQTAGQFRVLRFANKRYRLEFTGGDFDKGTLTVIEIRSGKRWKKQVTGSCGV